MSVTVKELVTVGRVVVSVVVVDVVSVKVVDSVGRVTVPMKGLVWCVRDTA